MDSSNFFGNSKGAGSNSRKNSVFGVVNICSVIDHVNEILRSRQGNFKALVDLEVRKQLLECTFFANLEKLCEKGEIKSFHNLKRLIFGRIQEGSLSQDESLALVKKYSKAGMLSEFEVILDYARHKK